MDPATSDVRAVDVTPSRDGDSPGLPDLLGRRPVDSRIGTVTADRAQGTRRKRDPARHTPFRPGVPDALDRIPPAAGSRRGCAASRPSASASWRETRTAEIHIRVALVNRFNAPGTADTVRAA